MPQALTHSWALDSAAEFGPTSTSQAQVSTGGKEGWGGRGTCSFSVISLLPYFISMCVCVCVFVVYVCLCVSVYVCVCVCVSVCSLQLILKQT